MKQTDYHDNSSSAKLFCSCDCLWLVQIASYGSYMKKIAFTYNSCICMILFLPDFECIDFLCIVDAWWGMESV